MVSVSIQNLKRFEIVDASGGTFYGGWQGWYKNAWKRIAGCGPTVISSIIHYLNRTAESASGDVPTPKGEFQALMEEVWRFVTPSVRGLPSPSSLAKGARAYLAFKGLAYTIDELDIPRNKRLRPDFASVVAFIEHALASDTPVAFLSLDKGAEEQLDSWHWVTLLSLRYAPDNAFAEAGVADEGKHFQVDLRKWYDTTPLGGGLVRFIKSTDHQEL